MPLSAALIFFGVLGWGLPRSGHVIIPSCVFFFSPRNVQRGLRATSGVVAMPAGGDEGGAGVWLSETSHILERAMSTKALGASVLRFAACACVCVCVCVCVCLLGICACLLSVCLPACLVPKRNTSCHPLPIFVNLTITSATILDGVLDRATDLWGPPPPAQAIDGLHATRAPMGPASSSAINMAEAYAKFLYGADAVVRGNRRRSGGLWL